MRRAALVLAALSVLVAACAERPRPARIDVTPTRGAASPTRLAAETRLIDLARPPGGLLRIAGEQPLMPRPVPTFTLPAGAQLFDSVVLFDLRRGTSLDLGIGGGAVFAPGGRYMAWVTGAVTPSLRSMPLAAGDVRIFDLERSVTLPLRMPASSRIEFTDDHTLFVLAGSSHPNVLGWSVDVVAGTQREVPAGSRYHRIPETDLSVEDRGTSFVVRDTSDRMLWSAQSDARAFRGFAGPGEILAAGIASLFVLDGRTGDVRTVVDVGAWSVEAANARFLAWQSVCRPSGAVSALILFDRESGTAVRVGGGGEGMPVVGGFLADGRLLDGRPGGPWTGVVDPRSGRWSAVFPPGAHARAISEDGRFAASGRSRDLTTGAMALCD
jgi:hypothetical protein